MLETLGSLQPSLRPNPHPKPPTLVHGPVTMLRTCTRYYWVRTVCYPLLP